MGRSIRTHIRHNVVGYVALFLALTGTAYAAGLAPNSVLSRHIKDGEVRSRDVADDSTPRALKGKDIANDALTGQDVAQDSLDGWDIHDLSFADLQPNTLNSGTIQDNGIAGADLGTTVIRTATDTVVSGAHSQVIASCDNGEQLLSGGGGMSGAINSTHYLDASYPVQVGDKASWLVQGDQYSGSDQTLTAYALCLQ
jgi:hypothetical protein